MVTALIDWRAQISSILITLANTLKLEIKSLKTMLDQAATRGSRVPYLGYLETRLKILEVKAFDRDV